MNGATEVLRVAINAQILPGRGSGGVESVVAGLVRALGRLEDGTEEYVIIGPWQDPGWLRTYVGPNERIVSGPRPAESSLARALGRLIPLAAGWRSVLRRLVGFVPSAQPQVPVSDGFYEGLGCHVIHFPSQQFVICALPSVYNPHDLQHLHYPQFFAPSTIARRETIYPAGCHFAHTVTVASQWVKQDLVDHYRMSARKVQVIPWAPPTQAYPEPSPGDIAAAQRKYELKVPFALYPSMTWEHKNHIRLLEALALLRDRAGLRLNLVCTGHKHDFWNHIEERLVELELEDQVSFLGMVPPEDLRALYRLARFVVMPSLFEAASGPLFEGWQEDTPVACSAVTSLPEQAGDAALLFDPLSVEAIAQSLARMATDDDLLEGLRQRGRRRLQDFSWERTAKAYRAVYRRAAGLALNDEDRWLLEWDWMREPQRGMGAGG
ncbi:MAG: glycosyltransferase family 4 protein [Chloroflexota bacterium]